jgi:ribosome-associated protein
MQGSSAVLQGGLAPAIESTSAATTLLDPATLAAGPLVSALFKIVDEAKANDILVIDLAGKTAMADAMVIASGRSDRHVGAIAQRLLSALKQMGLPAPRVEGMPVCDWVLIDTGDVILHLFRPEVRVFYNLEKLWGIGRPLEGAVGEAQPPKAKHGPSLSPEQPPPLRRAEHGVDQADA